MKKFFKALALVLALALVIGVVPAQATSAKIKAKKTLYVDGAKGTSTDGTKTSSYKERVAIYKLAGAKKADKEDHKFTAKIKSGDSVTVSKNYVYAAGLGKSVVELFKDGESLGTTVITVKKNATEDTLTITELEDGKEVVCGVEYTVTLPRKGVDTDERRLFVDDKAVEDKEDAPRAYAVKFTKAGDHKVKFEAFQSAELDKATASKEITVKAIMPKADSAKQVTANSFAVTFTGDMTDLISKENITNEMVYYVIADKPIVTGVVKDVKVEKEVVTVTMYSNFNSDTDYFFAYGDADPVKFHTAKNDIKYATSMKLIPEKAYYVGQQTAVTYKFYNADGVELDITDQVATLSYESDVAYLIGNKIYFYKTGEATIKASIITGYEAESNTPIKLEDVLTVTGVEKTTTRTGTVYSFGAAPSKQITSIRIGDAAKELQIKYTLSDSTTAEINTNGATNTQGYYLRSADERIAMIKDGGTKVKSTVYGVSEGSTYIILCDKDGKDLDVFPITVLGRNRVSNATTIDLTKETLNLNSAKGDSLKLVIQGIDLNNEKNGSYKYTIEQATNNEDAVGIKFKSPVSTYTNTNIGAGGTAGKFELPLNYLDFDDKRADKTGVAVVRLTVNVKNDDDVVVATKTVSFAVSDQTTADAWQIATTKTALDASIKDWGTTDPLTEKADITAQAVKMVSGYPFFIETLNFEIISSVNAIPVTAAAGTANYVVVSKPSGSKVTTGAAIVTVSAFEDATHQGKTGTYTFTGVHVDYPNDTAHIGVRTPMGTVNVVVSKSDVLPTVEIVDGTAKAFKDNFGVLEGTSNAALAVGSQANAAKVIVASWAGKNSKDNNDRVKIAAINYSGDKTTGAFYLTSVDVTVDLRVDNTGAAVGTNLFTKTVSVGQLFKDK